MSTHMMILLLLLLLVFKGRVIMMMIKNLSSSLCRSHSFFGHNNC